MKHSVHNKRAPFSSVAFFSPDTHSANLFFSKWGFTATYLQLVHRCQIDIHCHSFSSVDSFLHYAHFSNDFLLKMGLHGELFTVNERALKFIVAFVDIENTTRTSNVFNSFTTFQSLIFRSKSELFPLSQPNQFLNHTPFSLFFISKLSHISFKIKLVNI